MSCCSMSLLGFPFKWANTRGGFRVEWLGMETEYNSSHETESRLVQGLALR